VIDGTESPLSRIRVTIIGANADRGRYKPGRQNQNLHYGEREVRVTDDLGRVRFPDLAVGRYTVVASRGGGSKVQRSIEVTTAEMLEVLIAFDGSRPVTVRVADENGEAVADAFVSAVNGRNMLNGRTNASGEVTLNASGPLTNVQVVFVAPSSKDVAYLMPPMLKRIADDQAVVGFVLRRAESITGVVRDPDGNLVVGALITAAQESERSMTVYSDGSGQFRINVAPNARVDVVFQRVRGNNGLNAVPWTGALKGVSAGARDLVLRLRKVEGGRSVRVLVLDPEGKAVEGARVMTIPLQAGGKQVMTNAEGRVTLTNLLKTTCRLLVFQPKGVALTSVAPKAEDFVPAGQQITVKFRRAIHFRGKVLGSFNANVTLYRMVDGEQVMVSSTTADREGNFALFLGEDEGNGPFLLMANGRASGGIVAARAEDVYLDGPAPVLQLK